MTLLNEEYNKMIWNKVVHEYKRRIFFVLKYDLTHQRPYTRMAKRSYHPEIKNSI